MKVSIITVCFNSAATLRDAIESVLAQSYADIEYIVVDGASTDRSVDILYEYKEGIARIISEPDDGIYDAMNQALSDSEKPQVKESEATDWKRKPKGKHILVAEDDHISAQLMSTLLTNAGHTVGIFNDGFSALQEIRTGK